ncbi:MAG: GNAT family N-acetyltransferase [Gammaproteobacteria bacterium]|nr:GNAT family N-acetyltransferase [Gammaproteobacteria bacterium]
MKTLRIVQLTPEDYPALLSLWQQGAPGVQLREADDNATAIASLLVRNPGLCLGAWDGAQLVGAVLAGCDGRRAYLYHFVVATQWRGSGIGRTLAQALTDALRSQRVSKAHLFVLNDNQGAQQFWAALGWRRRDDLTVYSCDLIDGPDEADDHGC